MGGLALLARELGLQVSGADQNVYPPMSEQLAAAGIALTRGYAPQQLQPAPAEVVVGNALSRGNPCVEYLLEQGLCFSSGPQWLRENVLRDRWVLAVAGTHGKTSTSSMLAWILECAGLAPGFLIGGVPLNFGVSARLGGGSFFVVEADEYDTAFFDKRSKFVHYYPRTLVLNNLEFDHADIFADLAAIQRQFHHLLRCVPASGRIVRPLHSAALDAVIEMGCWSEVETVALEDSSASWSAALSAADGSAFGLRHAGGATDVLQWAQLGEHNVLNALAAIAAARHVGVPPAQSLAALAQFRGVRRRLELLADVDGVCIYDDFAHHPTAIATTLAGLRARGLSGRLLALIEPRSNTMRMGCHSEALAAAVSAADSVYWYQSAGINGSLRDTLSAAAVPGAVFEQLDALLDALLPQLAPGDQVVIMSNGSFDGVHQRLLDRLRKERG
jgi:UDP-N-acetylmuramate: L-alanyl-gamma-D-glutamyl-meso-diaminopimelate ligase